jgi:hypothetical protein
MNSPLQISQALQVAEKLDSEHVLKGHGFIRAD